MKKSFYLKYLEQQGATNKKQIKLDEKTESSNFFIGLIKKSTKILYYIFLSVLISIGLTVLINPSIREIFINLFKGGFSLWTNF